MFIKPQVKEKDLRKESSKDMVIDRIIDCNSFKLKDREILGRSPGEPTFCLGRYLSPVRAAEVFHELEQAIQNKENLFKMPVD